MQFKLSNSAIRTSIGGTTTSTATDSVTTRPTLSDASGCCMRSRSTAEWKSVITTHTCTICVIRVTMCKKVCKDDQQTLAQLMPLHWHTTCLQ
eukprot:706-Heterococcus_DN1.PRE.2